MRVLSLIRGLGLVCFARGTILQNGQIRPTDYPDTSVDLSTYSLKTYASDAAELSYKGRWDSRKVSWWSAPGLKFGYTGQTVAITFGNLTSDGVLIGYRIDGLDWMFTNITAGATHLLVSPDTPGSNLTSPINPSTFEMRVTNWAYGVQISAVHVASGEKLVKLPNYPRAVEFIGDSLTSGMYTTYEGLSSFGFGIGAGLGETEFSITAYPGICAADQNCWGNPRGQVHQWFYTSDTSGRAINMYGDNPEPWNFSTQQSADLVIINIGTNDQNSYNNVTTETYVDSLTKLIQGVHGVWPEAQVVLMSLWLGFYQYGNTFYDNGDDPINTGIYSVYQYFNTKDYLDNPVVYDGVTNKTRKLCKKSEAFVHLFNTTGILQHNDIGPQYHPTDVGAIKVASHAIQFIKLTLGWDLAARGLEIQHDTLYWNDEQNY
ncbi:Lipase, GDSL-like protein [Pleurostoma richardsiae]|uniref:Lipase, GDSL-like protein n=1 Tax=Pleurostoma richardsiae TaxID=41990 RepID=A0AA38RRZ2_9PEZI|nr:Lipase, GDSL-like protein [Pleurostoma richardsiae]